MQWPHGVWQQGNVSICVTSNAPETFCSHTVYTANARPHPHLEEKTGSILERSTCLDFRKREKQWQDVCLKITTASPPLLLWLNVEVSSHPALLWGIIVTSSEEPSRRCLYRRYHCVASVNTCVTQRRPVITWDSIIGENSLIWHSCVFQNCVCWALWPHIIVWF